jgi:hypothetical protein
MAQRFSAEKRCYPGQQCLRRLIRRHANQGIASLGNAAGDVGFAGLVFLGRQSEMGTYRF